MKRIFIQKKGICILLLLLLCASVSFAQNRNKIRRPFRYPRKHNISLGFGGGVGGMLINGSFASPTTYGLVPTIDVSYIRLFTENVGLEIGLSMQNIKGSFSANNLSSSFVSSIAVSDGTSYHNENAEFTYITKDVKETYDMPLIEIPIRMTYTKDHWNMAGGIKLGIPTNVTAHYDYSDGVIGITKIIGTGTELEELLPIGSYDAMSGDYDVCSRGKYGIGKMLYFTLSIEGGYKIYLGQSSDMQISLYANYALNKIYAGCEGDVDFISFPDGVPTFSNCVNSNQIMGFNYLTCGVKLSYNLGFGERVGVHRFKMQSNRRNSFSRSIGDFFSNWKTRRHYRKATRRGWFR